MKDQVQGVAPSVVRFCILIFFFKPVVKSFSFVKSYVINLIVTSISFGHKSSIQATNGPFKQEGLYQDPAVFCGPYILWTLLFHSSKPSLMRSALYESKTS